MSLMQSAQNIYGRPEAPTRSLRAIEYDLLAKTTQRLQAAANQKEQDFPAFVAALNANSVVWSTLAADVASSANGLPAKLRAQLFYLYEFTADHTVKILNKGASVDVLVDINTAVMRGLRGEGVLP